MAPALLLPATMKTLLASLGCTIAACTTQPVTTTESSVTLAELAPELQIAIVEDERGEEMVVLQLATELCAGLAGGSATLGGAHGQPVPGGVKTTVHDDFGHTEIVCSIPQFHWARSVLPGGLVTLEVSDDVTTLRMRLHLPSEPPSFSIVEPSATYHPGETVVLRTNDPGELLTPTVTASADGTFLFTIDADGLSIENHLDPETVLVVEGQELRFEVPASSHVVAETSVTLAVDASLKLRIAECDSPWGCDATPRLARNEIAISLSPSN